MEYVIQDIPAGQEAEGVYEPYGVVKDFFHYFGPECMLSGPFDTGKTFGALNKLLTLSWLYRNLHVAVVRKTYASLKASALQTLWDKVLSIDPQNPPSEYDIYGGGSPQTFKVVPTNSLWRFVGMDEPTRLLSGEFDFIYVVQAEELNLNDWEMLTGRCNGRAGHSPFFQVMGDCNPDVPTHWIVNRPPLKLFETTHLDNPTIYQRDAAGNLVLDEDGEPVPTPGGVHRLRTLKNMTGLRYKRGFLGLWVGAEGVVYGDFDPKKHVIDRHPIPPEWKRYRSIDFGFTHPFVCQWWAEDDYGRLIMYREIFMTGRTVRDHAELINELTGEEKITATICDWDAEDRATLEENGIKTIKADKRVKVGIEKCEDRLKSMIDGKPKVMFMRDSLVEQDETLKDKNKPTRTTEEFPGYVWANIGDKEATARDERPIKKNDDGMDAFRYLVMYFDGFGPGKTKVYRYA